MRIGWKGVLFLAAALAACSSTKDQPQEPERIRVQHVLIGFTGSMGNLKKIQRSKDEAERLALDVLAKARGGEEFGGLVQQYTDDKAPGIYGLTNDGIPLAEAFLPRRVLPSGFGNVAFRMQVGDISLCPYDPNDSPMGWHVIKRLE
jgi:parvulin-like peptidyl-prolyl cis-trans isomerase-like protein